MKRTLATIDCETDPFVFGRIPKPFLWDVFDGAKHYTFEHVSDAVHCCMQHHWCVYAHNGGKFDYCMPGFLDELESFDKVMLINGRLAQFKLGECEFRDSYNILPIPLAQFQKQEIDYALFEPDKRQAHMAEITRYLHSDTENLFKLVSAFRENYGPGLTLAGSAMRVWQESSRIKAPQSSKGFYKEVAPFYHGGRVECFRTGIINEEFHMVDINSAYPYAMLHEHPISTEMTERTPRVNETIIPQSMYEIEAICNGALPVITGKNLSFPDDTRVHISQCSGWEVLAHIETGGNIRRIIRRLDFDKTINFSKYIHHFYEMKKDAGADPKRGKNSPDYIFAKLFMNSLYGKFGANPEEYSNHEVMSPKYHDAAVADGYTCAGEMGKWLIMSRDLDPEQERYYNVGTAASITGFVRAYLWRALHSIRAHGGEPYYCDTDSISFRGAGTPNIPIGKELGEWTREGPFDRGGIGGKKLYAFHVQGTKNEWHSGCKGVRITPQEILKVCRGKTVTYKRDAPTMSIGKPSSFVVRKVRMTGKMVDKDCQ